MVLPFAALRRGKQVRSMVSRELLKNNAKGVLRRNYWYSFLACLLTVAIIYGIRNISSGFNTIFNFGHIGNIFSGNYRFPLFQLGFAGFWALISVLIGVAVSIFLDNVFSVGLCRYFIKGRKEKENISNIFSCFNSREYLNVVKAMALYFVYVCVGLILLIVPGIIMFYTYRFVPYILAENPTISPKRALQLSKQMTQGEKFNLFVLDLSFLGWVLLGALALGVGIFFVVPYMEATYAEAYINLSEQAIRKGHTNFEELGRLQCQAAASSATTAANTSASTQAQPNRPQNLQQQTCGSPEANNNQEPSQTTPEQPTSASFNMSRESVSPTQQPPQPL